MLAEIISIGDELLIGQTINTNAAYIGAKLTEIGIEVNWITSVGDDRNALFSVLAIAEKRADVIICTGGLGPTHDDLTKDVFVTYFKAKLICNEKILNKIKSFFFDRGVEMPNINEEQALVPDNATVIENNVGTAPGLLFLNQDNKMFFVLPGVPFEMKTMIDNEVVPILKTKSKKFIKYKILKTTGIGESSLFEKIDNIQELEKFVKIAFLPKITGVEIRINSINESEELCLKNMLLAESKILEKISQYVWGKDDENLEDIVVNLLIKKHKTVAVVESCSGGALTDRLTNHLNSNSYLSHSIISNNLNTTSTILGVLPESLIQFGAISAEIAVQMAQKIKDMNFSDFGVAINGNWTPTQNDEDFGVTLIAVSDHDKNVCEKLILKRDINFNKQRTAQVALDLLRRRLLIID